MINRKAERAILTTARMAMGAAFRVVGALWPLLIGSNFAVGVLVALRRRR